MRKAPLEGLIVVALEQAVAAPYCTSRLADAGARVIKIERKEGDFARGYDDIARGESSYFVWLNRGKQSVVLNIKDEKDRTLLNSILAKADIFIQNLAPGAMKRLGLDAKTITERHPNLIYASISGYGEAGEYTKMKAYDLLVQAESGLCSVTGSAEAPGRVGVSVCDIAAGVYSYMAILEALIERSVSGRGKTISVSLFDGMAEWMNVPLLHQMYGNESPPRVGLNHPSIAPYGAFNTSEDGQIILVSIQNEREWNRFVEQVLEMPEILNDERFKGNVNRVANRASLDKLIQDTFYIMGEDKIGQKLQAASIAFGRLNGTKELLEHPQLRLIDVDTPNGKVSMAAPPALFDGKSRELGAVPAIGAHTEEIWKEFSDQSNIE